VHFATFSPKRWLTDVTSSPCDGQQLAKSLTETALADQTCKRVGAIGVETDPDVAKASLVVAGMKTHPGVAADMFDALSDAGVNIEIISTSSIRVSCVIRASDVERAVKAIHDRFRLSEDVVYREKHPATVTDQMRALKGES
jgi:aspartate kinase